MPSKLKSVWETLSPIDCNAHTEVKNGFTYLSWAWAWKTLKEHYPNARFEKIGITTLADGSALVGVRVWIPDGDSVLEDITELLPVLDFKNKPVCEPNCFDVNSAYQRCLVKCLAYMGLGMYIYQGETTNPDAPVTVSVTDINGEVIVTDVMSTVADVLITFIKGNDSDIDKLRTYWSQNKQALDHLQKYDPESYKRVYDTFIEIADALKGDK